MSDWSDIDTMAGGGGGTTSPLDNPLGWVKSLFGYPTESSTETEDAGGYPQRIVVNEQGDWEVYTGPGLVTSSGRLLRNRNGQIKEQYDIENEPWQVYTSLSPGARNMLLEKLDAGGFFSVGGPGNVEDELRAIQNAMETANRFGLDLSNMVDTRLAGMPIQRRGGSGYRRPVTSSEDLKVVARQVSQQTLGRELSPAELDQFVASYQGRERGAGGATQIPSIDVAAQEFSRQVAPTEANAYEYLGYVNQLFNMIGVQ